MKEKETRIRRPGAKYEVVVRGADRTPFSDFYHALLRLPWWVSFLTIVLVFLTSNLVFALIYVEVGGVANAQPGSIADAFFFSVQTMGTIGYGNMYPSTHAANTVVVAESTVSLILTALATGLVFAKFSRSTSRFVFTHEAVIYPRNGVPTLTFRLGNQRGNQIVNAEVHLSWSFTETLDDGKIFYRSLDLKLSRERFLTLSRSWTVLHIIDESSPLFGITPEKFSKMESELQVMVVGLDDTSLQSVHAGTQYFTHQVLWGARHKDILSESEDGNVILDLRGFHDIESTAATPSFPYSHKSEGTSK